MTILPDRLTRSPNQRADVIEAIEAWNDLKKTRWDHRGQKPTLQNILRILQFVGLQCDTEEVKYDSPRRFTRNSPRRDLTLQIEPENIPAGLRGIPQFGSESGGTYHIACLWDARPDLVTSTRHVRENAADGRSAVIVIYLGGLTKNERSEIKLKCYKENLSVAVLDEILFEFLAYQSDIRLASFLNCTLAYSSPNPYIPEEGWGAPVPPEMFYGRDQIIAEIENMSNQGRSLLFGGRQLGKTSLLRHIEYRMHIPEQRRFAWFIDLKGEQYIVGKDKDPMEIWRILLKRFVDDGLISADHSSDTPDNIRDSLRSVIRGSLGLQILVMFDEADVFLETDTQNGAPVVESMRTMMAETNRFKVVFAGLHSVQRFAFASRPNNPFLNLGFDESKPRRGGLGPLGYPDAQRLIQEPLRTMGFQFEYPLLVDRILTYTECHPAEVQFFCHRLVRLIREQRATEDVPIIIRQSDVDEVAESQDILGGIRRRFEETFKLDRWYHAISLCMIFDYDSSSHESRDLNQVRSLLNDLFQSESDEENLTDQRLNSLLTEMVGLGILAYDGSGYHIRSPRIARVFGSPDDVELELLELSERGV